MLDENQRKEELSAKSGSYETLTVEVVEWSDYRLMVVEGDDEWTAELGAPSAIRSVPEFCILSRCSTAGGAHDQVGGLKKCA